MEVLKQQLQSAMNFKCYQCYFGATDKGPLKLHINEKHSKDQEAEELDMSAVVL